MLAEEHVKTGIMGLDELIENGFERKSIVIVTGDAGCGKTTFIIQFLYNGATLYNEPGLLITFEEQKEMLFKHMARFGWDLPKLEEEKKLFFLEYPPHEVDRFITEGAIIEDIIRENGIKRIGIDSITSFALLYENEYKRRQAFLNAMSMMRRWGTTCLLTSESITLRSGEMKTRFGLEYLADGLIALHAIRRGDIKEMALEVIKLRGIIHEKRLYPMKITRKGIAVYPGQAVFGER